MLLSLLLILPPAAQADLHSDMVKLDQAYIPALMLSAESQAMSAPAVDALLRRWAWFKQRQAYRADRDSQWNFDLTDIEHAILNAQRLVEQGEYGPAHEALETVRDTLMRMRARLDTDYFPDTLVSFQAAMQHMLDAMSTDDSPAARDARRRRFHEAQQRWEAVMDRPFNAYDYGLDVRAGGKLQQYMHSETKALQRLGAAMRSGDKASQATAASEIQACFRLSYRLFGHFPEAPPTAMAR